MWFSVGVDYYDKSPVLNNARGLELELEDDIKYSLSKIKGAFPNKDGKLDMIHGIPKSALIVIEKSSIKRWVMVGGYLF